MELDNECRWCDKPIHRDVKGRWEHDHNGMYNCDALGKGVATSRHIATPKYQ